MTMPVCALSGGKILYLGGDSVRAGQSVVVASDTRNKDRLLVTPPVCALSDGLVCCLTGPDHSWSCPGVHPGSLCQEFAPGVPGVCTPGVHPGVHPRRLCSESVPGVIQGLLGAPVLCYNLCLHCLQPVFNSIRGDSVCTGLPVLVSSHAGDCGRLLLIFLNCCLAEFCLCLWCNNRASPAPPTPLGPVYRTLGHAHPDCKTARGTVTVSSAAEALVHAYVMARVIWDRIPFTRAPAYRMP